MIDFQRWPEIKAIMQAALDRPEEERARYLDEACGTDEELRREVEALLAVSSTRADFFDSFQVLPPALRRADLAEGDVVGHYRIIRPLGQGGMGSVYLAQDTEVDRKVALKTLPRRLTQEQELHARLQHPNIAIFFESGTTKDGYGYFAMEYVEGETITDYCDEANLGLKERLALFLQVCNAVSFAHRNLVVHRDIKPSNILVTKEGSPKLLDFGIAKLLPAGDDPLTLTQPQERSLTLAFASPEQLQGERTTTATDIYSLGVLLCLLITGRLPYSVKSYHDLPWAIRNMEPEKPSRLILKEAEEGVSSSGSMSGSMKLSRTLRGDLDEIVLKTLRKEPEKRYQTVGELAADIQRHLADEPVSAVKGSTRYRARKFVRRHAGFVVTTTVAALIILALLVGLFLEERETARQRDRAADEAAQSKEIANFLVELFDKSNAFADVREPLSPKALVDSAAIRLSREFPGRPQIRGRLLATLADVYTRLGEYNKAEPLLQTALAIQRKAVGEHHVDTANTYGLLGALYYYRGDNSRADEYYRKALAIVQTNQDAKPEDRVASLADYGRLRYVEGNFHEAEALTRQALGICRRFKKEDTSECDMALSDLASVLREEDHFSEAEATARKVLEMRQHRLGDMNPNTGIAYNDLAGTLMNQKRYAEAEPLFRKALSIYEASLPSGHPEIATAMNNLGNALTAVGESREAESLYRKALQIRVAAFGPHHRNVANSLNNLGFFLAHDPARLPEAEALFRQALAIDTEIYKADHPSTIGTLKNLAVTLDREKRYAESEHYFKEALARSVTGIGGESVATAEIKLSYVKLLFEKQDYRHGYTVATEALSVLQRKYPATDYQVMLCKEVIGANLAGLGKFDQAEPMLLGLYKEVEGRPSNSSLKKTALGYLEFLYDSWHKPQEAAKYRKLLAETNPK